MRCLHILFLSLIGLWDTPKTHPRLPILMSEQPGPMARLAEVTRPVAPRVRRANAPRVSLWRLRVEDPSSQHRASDWEARDRTGESDPLPFERKDLRQSQTDFFSM